jgi:hypothetical protein
MARFFSSNLMSGRERIQRKKISGFSEQKATRLDWKCLTKRGEALDAERAV